jgi:hypothetical protein
MKCMLFKTNKRVLDESLTFADTYNMLIKPNEASSDPLDRFSKEFFQKVPFVQQSYESFAAQFELLHDIGTNVEHEQFEDKALDIKEKVDDDLEIEDVVCIDEGELFGSGTNMTMIELTKKAPKVYIGNFVDEETSDDENESNYQPSVLSSNVKPSQIKPRKNELSSESITRVLKFECDKN